MSHPLGFELNRRIIADYEEGGVTTAGAAEAIENAQGLVAEVARFLEEPTERKY